MCYLYSGWKSCESVPKLVDEYLAGKLKVDEFITHSFPLDKINEAFELMHAGKRLVNKFCVKLFSFFFYLEIRSSFHMYTSQNNLIAKSQSGVRKIKCIPSCTGLFGPF